MEPEKEIRSADSTPHVDKTYSTFERTETVDPIGTNDERQLWTTCSLKATRSGSVQLQKGFPIFSGLVRPLISTPKTDAYFNKRNLEKFVPF
jgi:hypothetical protein